jgi:hypothetical protein
LIHDKVDRVSRKLCNSICAPTSRSIPVKQLRQSNDPAGTEEVILFSREVNEATIKLGSSCLRTPLQSRWCFEVPGQGRRFGREGRG